MKKKTQNIKMLLLGALLGILIITSLQLALNEYPCAIAITSTELILLAGFLAIAYSIYRFELHHTQLKRSLEKETEKERIKSVILEKIQELQELEKQHQKEQNILAAKRKMLCRWEIEDLLKNLY